MVKARILHLKIIHYLFVLLLFSVCKDLNHVPMTIQKKSSYHFLRTAGSHKILTNIKSHTTVGCIERSAVAVFNLQHPLSKPTTSGLY